MWVFLGIIDKILIGPYRWVHDPILGWLFGTFILCIWAVILGELTLNLAFWINKRYVKENLTKTDYYFQQSLKAKEAGDEDAYKKINRLANEEFGKSFFLLMAMGMGFIWPAFFAAAWLNIRFGDITFLSLPHWMGGYQINFIGPFIILYIIARFVVSKLRYLLKRLI